jgi:hypothetical protein
MFEDFVNIPFVYWSTAVALLVGSMVASLVYVTLRRYALRRRLAISSKEEDLPWEVLLDLLRTREREMAASGAPPDKELPPDELLALLLSQLPAMSGRRLQDIPLEERQALENGAERRTGRRRWGNPTRVLLTSPLLPGPVNGIVINRSTGGLGIFVDQAVQPDTHVEVRAVEAPGYVPSAEVEIKYCRKVRGQFMLGGQFRAEIPWNVRVWFG